MPFCRFRTQAPDACCRRGLPHTPTCRPHETPSTGLSSSARQVGQITPAAGITSPGRGILWGMTIKAGPAALTLGGILLAIGLFLGFSPSGATTQLTTYFGTDCGSVFVHDPSAQCDQARNGRATTTWAFVIAGGLLALAGGVITVSGRTDDTPAARAAARAAARTQDDPTT